MRKCLVWALVIVLCFLFCACDRNEDNKPSETASATEFEDDGEYVENVSKGEARDESKHYQNKIFSKDYNANRVINQYNIKNPDSMIAESMVTYSYESYMPVTVVKCGNGVEFIVSEADGSPYYSCESSVDDTNENLEIFKDTTYKWLKATYPNTADDTLRSVVDIIESNSDGMVMSSDIKGVWVSYQSPATTWVPNRKYLTYRCTFCKAGY